MQQTLMQEFIIALHECFILWFAAFLASFPGMEQKWKIQCLLFPFIGDSGRMKLFILTEEGSYALQFVSAPMRCSQRSGGAGVLQKSLGDYGCQSRASYVGGAGSFRCFRVGDRIFLRMFSWMCVLSEPDHRSGRNGQNHQQRNADGKISDAAGDGRS